MYGYELRQEIERRRMERWADIKYGSIYPGLRRLAADGFVERTGTSRRGNLPSRTTFQITEAGRRELRRLLRDAVVRPQFTAQPVDVALCFARLLDAQEMADLFEERLRILDEVARRLEEARRRPMSPEPGQAIVADVVDHGSWQVATEQRWAMHVLGRLREGLYARISSGAGE